MPTYTQRLGDGGIGLYWPRPPRTFTVRLGAKPRVTIGLLWPLPKTAVRQPVGISEPLAVRPEASTGQTWPRH